MLRELFRYWQKLIGHRSREKNRFQNLLTVSNIALASVLSDTFGKSAKVVWKTPFYPYTTFAFNVIKMATNLSSFAAIIYV